MIDNNELMKKLAEINKTLEKGLKEIANEVNNLTSVLVKLNQK